MRPTRLAALARLVALALVLCACVAQAKRPAFGRRQGVKTQLADVVAKERETKMAPQGGGQPFGVAAWAARVQELRRALAAIAGTQRFENRTRFAAQFPKKKGQCQCCCCTPAVTNHTYYDNPSAELDAELKRKGILGCADIAASLKPIPGKSEGWNGGRKKRDSSVPQRFWSLRGRPVVTTRCSGGLGRAAGTVSSVGGHADTGMPLCSDVGVGTLIEKRASPFIADIIAYCPPSRATAAPGGHEGTVVLEHFPYHLDQGRVACKERKNKWGVVSFWCPDESGKGRLIGVPEMKLRVLAMCLGMIGAAKEYHSMGRLLADYGPEQHMVNAEGYTRLMDVDCTLEEHANASDEVSVQAKLLSCAQLIPELRAAVRDLPRAVAAQAGLPRRRDFQMATMAMCMSPLTLRIIVPILASAMASSSDHARRNLHRTVHDRVQVLFKDVADPDGAYRDWDAIAVEIVNILTP